MKFNHKQYIYSFNKYPNTIIKMKDINELTLKTQSINHESETGIIKNNDRNVKINKINEENKLSQNDEPKTNKVVIYPILRTLLLFLIIVICLKGLVYDSYYI